MQLTFEKMGDNLIPPGYKLVPCDQSRIPLDFDNIVSAILIQLLTSYVLQHSASNDASFPPLQDEYLLFEDVIHFFHYALGVYGWPLYVYGHLMTGCCTLAQRTW